MTLVKRNLNNGKETSHKKEKETSYPQAQETGSEENMTSAIPKRVGNSPPPDHPRLVRGWFNYAHLATFTYNKYLFVGAAITILLICKTFSEFICNEPRIMYNFKCNGN